MRQLRNPGFTLLEAAFVIAVLAIILSAAVPSYRDYQQRQELQQAAEALMADLRNARELSVSSSVPIFVTASTGRPWCWGISRGQPCDCSGISPLPACNVQRGDSASFPDVVLDNAQAIEITPRLAQVAQAGGATLRTLKGKNLRVVMNPMGRVSACGPDSKGGTPCQ